MFGRLSVAGKGGWCPGLSGASRFLLSSCGSEDGVFAWSFLVMSPRSSGCFSAPLAQHYVQPSRAQLQGPFSKKTTAILKINNTNKVKQDQHDCPPLSQTEGSCGKLWRSVLGFI